MVRVVEAGLVPARDVAEKSVMNHEVEMGLKVNNYLKEEGPDAAARSFGKYEFSSVNRRWGYTYKDKVRNRSCVPLVYYDIAVFGGICDNSTEVPENKDILTIKLKAASLLRVLEEYRNI
ncbi:hypothetical protein QYM36_003185 [Artemia franciscana]|uniref:Uncharacterized protein n=1 Tax=Artemia franciscana TaxID=6661 RepID=A0AA88I502_ARTSF|nr:hypothetical protein QYM36_003185 [Artemia franciscana]